MRYLIYFLLFSTVVFSQNYNYGIDEAPKNTTPARPAPTVINNQLEEIKYFNSYLLPLSEKANIQNAIDTYGSVRLEKGDYTGYPVTLHSNQSLYGYNTLTPISDITIAAGSTNVHLESLNIDNQKIILEAGNPIKNCIIKTVRYGMISAIGAKLENNEFINIASRLQLDFSATGYYRNNKFIKQQSGIVSPIVSIKGNSTTLSYGNVHLWTNLLTPHGDGMILENLEDTSFIGIDAEGWNGAGLGDKAVVYARNVNNLKIAELGGANSYSPEPKTPGFDIQANNLLVMHSGIDSDAESVVSPNTNVMNIGSIDYERSLGTVTGYDITAPKMEEGGILNIVYNGVVQNETITDTNIISTIKNTFLGTKHTPWIRPVWETLPDPLGANWKAERIGKPDSKNYIQNLINTKGIAELPEGVFYIGSSITIGSNGQGILGSGSGKTVIVGLSDDFPLLAMATSGAGTDYVLSNLTLQGGSKGQFFPENYIGTAYLNTKYVIFRNQTIGIHLYKMGGTDNCFFDNVSFVNCVTGFKQEPKEIADNVNLSGYVDKTLFYKGQYINCGIGTSVHALRGNNLNAWVDCKYDGNEIAYSNAHNSYSIMANCDFKNNYGDFTIEGNGLSLYSCNFYNNTPTIATSNFVNIYAEGCNFLDNVQFAESNVHNDCETVVVNSTIVGDVVKKNRTGNKIDNSFFINTSLPFHPTLSKFMMKIKNEKTSIIIDSEPNPYPQFLVTQ